MYFQTPLLALALTLVTLEFTLAALTTMESGFDFVPILPGVGREDH